MTEKKMQEIADFYGLKHQTKRVIEKMGELIATLARGKEEWINDDRPELIWIIEELADVELTMTQIKYLMGIEDDVNEMVSFKTNQTMKKIQGFKDCGHERWIWD